MPRKVEFQGTVHEFPDNATDDQIRAALTGGQQQQKTADAQPGPVKRFLGGVYDSTVGPLVHQVTHPMETLTGIVGQGVMAAQHPIETLKDYGGKIANSLFTAGMPEEVVTGDHATALGKATGTAASFLGPELLKGAKVPVLPKMASTNPTEAAALDYLETKGVPANAAARTGNAFVKNAQKAADSTPLGAVVAARAEAQTTNALKAEASSLASRAHSTPVVPEQAGAGVRSALSRTARNYADQAETSYNTFRQIEQQTPMNVDVSQIKAELRPIYEDMQKWMEPAKRNASAGFTAIKSILEGPDSIPASQAEAGLGGLKALAREGAGRNSGLAKFITPKLQGAIDEAVGTADPQALMELRAGRSSTAAQHGTQAVLDDIRTEPVQAFRQMVYAKDAGIDMLRKVAKEAPGEMKKVGRAWLEDAFAKAQEQGGFGHTARLYSDWENLGPETKKLLFNPLLVNDLDKFFLGAKKLAENPNPSGTALVGISGSTGALIVTSPQTGVPLALGAGALSKLLHSSVGVKALTQGMKVGLKGPARMAAASQILKLAGDDAQPVGIADATENSPSERTGQLARAGTGR